MPIDGSIPLAALGQQYRVDPMAVAQGFGQLQNQRENTNALIAEREAATEQKRAAVEKAQREAADDAAFKDAILTSKDMTPEQFVEHVRVHAPGSYMSVQKAVTEYQDKAASAKKATAEAASASATAALHQQEFIAHSAYQIQQSDYNPVVVNAVLNGVVEQFPEWKGHADQIRQIAATQGKAALAQAVDSFITPETTKTVSEQQNVEAQIPGNKADSAVKAQVAAGTKNGMTPAQQATDRREGQRIALEKQKADTAATDVTQLTPEGLDAAAQMFAKTGQLPALGMGDKSTRKQIINRAAALMPGLDLASAKADYGANTDSLKNITKTLDTLSSFEATAGKNLDQFLSLASKVPDTGVPWLNMPMRVVNNKMVGDTNVAAFNAARDVALREIARVTNDPKLSGVLSDSARAEVSALSPQNATFAQIKAVAKVLKQDMANVHTSMSDQRDAIQSRIAKADTPAAKEPVSDLIYAKDPQGNVHQAKAGTPLPSGWVQVKRPGGGA